MAELARAALPRWNIPTAGITLLKLRENAVFRVDVPAGRAYVLRVHRHQYHSDAELESEIKWLESLESAGLEVPRCIPAASGRLFETVGSSAVAGARQVDLLAWIEGTENGKVRRLEFPYLRTSCGPV